MTWLLSKIANMPRKGAIAYILGLVFAYLSGMVLVILGVILVERGQFINPCLFYPGLGIWIPTLVVTILTALASNYAGDKKRSDGAE